MCELYVLWGWSVRQIAALLGIDRRRARRMLDDRGHHVPPHGGGRPRRGQRVAPSDSEMSVIRALYVREQRSTARIGEQVGLSAHTVRRVLREAGVRIRTRGGANREDRAQLEAAVIADLYLGRGLSADEVARRVGSSRRIVLRLAHDLGWPVRTGGPPARRGPEVIELIRALHADPSVRDILTEHGIAPVEPGGAIWERFAQPVPLSPGLLRELYDGCGLALTHIELLTGWPAATVRHRLLLAGIDVRPPGGRSPFMRRWRRASSV